MKKKQPRALITGVTGQDGSYLAEFLHEKGYKVFGLARRSSTEPFMRIEPLYLGRKLTVLNGNMRDTGSLGRALDEAKPDEIYNLAAQSDVGISFKCQEETFEINYYGFGRLVNEAVARNPNVRIYQASTSEMFGKTKPPQNERSPLAPVSPYGESKRKAHEDYVVGYRERHGLYICSGMLFNHESPRRGKHFVTRKITVSLAKIKLGLQDHFELGNLDAKRDWGFAGDYVEAMWMMLQQQSPKDYVIATGESRTVREFFDAAARALGISFKWKGKGLKETAVTKDGQVILRINPEFYRPVEVDYLLGDSTKARRELRWKPRHSFEDLVTMMATADYETMKKAV
jgi:GDPmannose 4,6-dehydratase